MDVMMKNISTSSLLAAINGGGVGSINKVGNKSSNFSSFRFSASPKNSLKFSANSLLRPISSTTQAHEGALVSNVQSGSQSKTARVKFILKKQCLFGEQFFLVGDDPMLGHWDPLKAIPMSWADDHIWTTDLDIPVGSSIQFKIILRGLSGEFRWQPGPDRIIRIWDTSKTIVVSEDWKNAESQKISEEELLISSSNESNVTADTQQKAADGKSLDNKKKPLKKEGAEMLVAGIAPNSVPKSTSHVVNGRASSALHASDVAKDFNSTQLYSEQEGSEAHSQKDKTEASNNNLLAKETITFSEKSSIDRDYNARETFRGTLTEDQSHQNEFDSQSIADIMGNNISWGLKALNQLLLIMGFTMNASAD